MAESSTNLLFYGSYATIVLLWAISPFVLIPYTAHLIILVTCILYAACHCSLSLLEEPTTDSVDGTPAPKDKEILQAEDAYAFPLVGSASLFGLYLGFKYLGEEWVNLLISGYFAAVGTFSVGMTLVPAAESVVKIPGQLSWQYKQKIPMISTPLDWMVKITYTEIFTTMLGGVITGLYFHLGKPWYLNNIIGISFCLQGIHRFSLGTYKIGAILLIGLFFYDIFWVFGTDVMVTVAKKLDGPIKILFPRSLERNEDGKLDLSLLGLGDIVIPGFFLALLLRFDAHQQKCSNAHDLFPKPYFHSAMVGYVAGIATTLFVMIYFNAAQPALLYLVPAVLGSSFACAVVRGEVSELLAYSEEEQEEESDEVKNESKKDN